MIRWQPIDLPARSAFVTIRYSTDALRQPVRPVLRLETRHGEQYDTLLPAAVCGEAEWTGLVPSGLRTAAIGVLEGAGPIDLRSIRPAKTTPLLRAALRRPAHMLASLGCAGLGWHRDAQLNLQRALAPTPRDILRDIARYWSTPPRADTSRETDTAAVLVIVVMEAAQPAALSRTRASLIGQSAGGWQAALAAPAEHETDWPGEPGFERMSDIPGSLTADYVAVIEAGDELAPDFVAAMRDRLAQDPSLLAVYCDELVEAEDAIRPMLKPAFSPALQEHVPYIGRAALLRADAPGLLTLAGRKPDAIVRHALSEARPQQVARLSRPLFRRRFENAAPRPTRRTSPPPTRNHGHVSIVIPQRDRADLIEALMASMDAHRAPAICDLVLVDNGSTAPRMLRLLHALRTRPGITVLEHPGAFNFSALCNAGARAAQGDVLLFLNNDIEFSDAGSIDSMLAHTLQGDVGAVGAKLLYPDGSVQHCGIALGLYGLCGHFGAQAPADATGWNGASAVAHEVSAVTGACLMVERTKFDAVDGFDEGFAVELGDVDLCLRLAERGWRTVCDAGAVFTHRESASRGASTFRRQSVHASDRDRFLSRWADRLLDDPYHHPAWPLFDVSAPPY